MKVTLLHVCVIRGETVMYVWPISCLNSCSFFLIHHWRCVLAKCVTDKRSLETCYDKICHRLGSLETRRFGKRVTDKGIWRCGNPCLQCASHQWYKFGDKKIFHIQRGLSRVSKKWFLNDPRVKSFWITNEVLQATDVMSDKK